MANTTDTDAAPSSTWTDREAIRDLANRYAHHVWRKEVAAVVELFTPDGVLETAALPPIRGREALLDGYRRMFEEDEFFPFVHNHVIELDGDVATGTCYIDLRAVIRGERLSAWGHYDDRYVRVDGTWRFATRTVNMSTYVRLGEELTENPQRTWED
ncbi:MAG: nuclear transport factor 2 family protein [Acidimicrobiia bacterium]|nr:nuclear transport factor 2 family protein [Acidimicrobiia bacterium]